MPQVSVVIPVHRGGPFARDAVRSATTQSLDDLEVLVVSDGCTEDLTDLERMDGRVQVLNRDHAGVSIARNSGVAASLGEYVAFLDEDDRSRPERLQSQFDALRDSPSAGMCHGGFQVMNVDGVVEGPRLGKELDYPAMLACQFPLLSSMMVRRSVFWEVGGFDPALVTGEDVDLALRIAMQRDVVFVPEVLTYYRVHDSNTTNTVSELWDTYPLIQRHRRWAEHAGRSDLVEAADSGLHEIRHNASNFAFHNARDARRRGNLPEAARQMALSFLRDPRQASSQVWSAAFHSSGTSAVDWMTRGCRNAKAKGIAR
ncbi:MAG: glycosyltransferase [Acidimicrobiales bacterium]|jgi:glycosyltransferase involved in cell wall biosynthesis